MKLPVLYEERAIAEIQAAYDWYEQQQLGLGERFVLAVEESASAISAYPFAYPGKHKKTREITVTPFPHILIYEVGKDVIYVIAVFPARMSPQKKYR